MTTLGIWLFLVCVGIGLILYGNFYCTLKLQIALYSLGLGIALIATPISVLVAHWLFVGDLWPFWGALLPPRFSVLPHSLGVSV